MKRATKPALKKTEEIITLHDEINLALKNSLQKAIRIGEILIEQKSKAKHGEWLPWIKENLPFSDETARKYMRLNHNRDKFQPDWNLTEAYEMILPPKKRKSEAIDVDFEEVETEPDDHGAAIMDCNDSDMKLCALIETALDGDLDTKEHGIIGFCPAFNRPEGSPTLLYVYPRYDENGEIYVKYKFTYLTISQDGEPGGYTVFNDRGAILYAFIMYLQWHPKINSEGISWDISKNDTSGT